jgi:hypothetical protein
VRRVAAANPAASGGAGRLAYAPGAHHYYGPRPRCRARPIPARIDHGSGFLDFPAPVTILKSPAVTGGVTA